MIRYVQDQAAAQLGLATVTLTPTAGNLLVAPICGFLPGTDTGATVSDNRGGVWKSIGTVNWETNFWSGFWYCLSAASSLSTIVSIGNASPNTSFINVSEWSGTGLNFLGGAYFYTNPAATTVKSPFMQVPSGRCLMVASMLNTPPNTGPQGLWSPLTNALRSFDLLTAYSLNDQHTPQQCVWGTPSSDSALAYIAAFAESPTFIEQRPIGGRGASR